MARILRAACCALVLLVSGCSVPDVKSQQADPVAPAVAGPPPPSALRPATTEERRGLDTTLASLVLLIKSARLDLPNANDSGERHLFSDEAARELVMDVERLGPMPDVFGVDNFYRAAHIAATAAIGDLQMLASLRSAQTSGRETLIGNAEKHLAKAQAAAAKMSKQ